MRDYRSKLVQGYISEGENIYFCNVRVRMTHDDKGKSLSLTAEQGDTGIQIGIPLESVEDIIKLVKKGGLE